jgi:hypothetical protein
MHKRLGLIVVAVIFSLVGRGHIARAGGAERQRADNAGIGRVLLVKTWQEFRLTIRQGRAGGGWIVVVDRPGGDQPMPFGISMAASVPTDAYLLSGGRVLVEADEGEGSRGAELMIVDAMAGRPIDHMYANAPSVSPDGRYLLFERRNVRDEEDHVGSVLLLYVTAKLPADNRTTSANSFLDIGAPVYPDYFRASGVYAIPRGSTEGGGRLVSRRPIWIDGRRAVFAYARSGRVSLVMLALDDAGHVSAVTERPLDAESFMKPSPVTASELLDVEEIKIVSDSGSATRVRLRLGPADSVRVRWVDVDVP